MSNDNLQNNAISAATAQIGAWIKEFPASIVVSNAAGKIIEMNDLACRTFSSYGGKDLIGKDLLELHPEPARQKVADLIKSQQQNVYTIEKKGLHKWIYQSPWYQNGEYAGFVELSMETPLEIPHFTR